MKRWPKNQRLAWSTELDPKDDDIAKNLDVSREPDCAGDRMTLPAAEAAEAEGPLKFVFFLHAG